MSIEALIMIALFIGLFIVFYFKGKHELSSNQKNGREFLETNRQNPEVHTTSSGLQYQVLQPAKPRDQFMLPKPDSTICVHYKGTLLDGTVFDSNEAQGKPVDFKLNHVIPGWQEGIQLMQIGEKTRFFIPSHLGYGDKKIGKIPPASTLIFDIKLVDFY